jgi:hypothetical protein
MTNPSRVDPKQAALALLAYCEVRNFAGYDPYDAVNSRIFELVPWLNRRLPRLVLTQALKRSPINLRPLLLVPRTQNPKGLGLFLAALVRLEQKGLLVAREQIQAVTKALMRLRSPGTNYWCWGYSFPWQTRTIVVPRGTPNLVCTTFIADALLDAYEHGGEDRYLEMGVSAAEYILKELYWTDGHSIHGLSYPLASERSQIHNANFLGAALLARVYRLSGDGKFLEPAVQVTRFSAGKQQPDGSWPYGELPSQAWVDNFHTGFNLCALHAFGRYARSDEFESNLRRGFAFYRRHFFRPDGAPKYFHDRTYPIDSHSVAQSLITLSELRPLESGNAELAQSVFRWAMEHLWNSEGYFYYRVLPFCTIRTSYMRWVQAWMLLALATLCDEPTDRLRQPYRHSQKQLLSSTP